MENVDRENVHENGKFSYLFDPPQCRPAVKEPFYFTVAVYSKWLNK